MLTDKLTEHRHNHLHHSTTLHSTLAARCATRWRRSTQKSANHVTSGHVRLCFDDVTPCFRLYRWLDLQLSARLISSNALIIGLYCMSKTSWIAQTMVAKASKQQSLTGFLRPTAKRDIGTSSSIAVKVGSPKNGVSERQPTLSVHLDYLDHEVPSEVLPMANKRRKIDPAGPPTTESGDGANSAVQTITTSHKSSTAEQVQQSEPVDDSDYPPPNHPSYHFPPSGSYNHPFTIPPIPQSLSSSLAFNASPKVIAKPELGLDLLYFKRFIDATCSSELTQYLLDSMPWYRVKYVVRGISINTPRYTTVFGKDATTTPWHGYDKAEPRAIPPILLKLMQKGESPPPCPSILTYR